MADGDSDSHVNKVHGDLMGHLNASKFGDHNVININYGAQPVKQKFDESLEEIKIRMKSDRHKSKREKTLLQCPCELVLSGDSRL